MMFQNKTIIITGGASGIGAATVTLFSRAGANVYILDKKKLTDDSSLSIHYLECDVSNADQVKSAIYTILQKNPKIDYLFCNAGIHLFANIEDSSFEAMQKVFATNLLGTIYCLQQI